MSACEQCEGTGVVQCWSPGGPCPVPNDPGCDTCGPCNRCLASVGNDGLTDAEREEYARRYAAGPGRKDLP